MTNQVTKQQIQDKADRCVDLYLPLDKIHVDPNVSLWVNTCGNVRRLYPRLGDLRLAQLEYLASKLTK